RPASRGLTLDLMTVIRTYRRRSAPVNMTGFTGPFPDMSGIVWQGTEGGSHDDVQRDIAPGPDGLRRGGERGLVRPGAGSATAQAHRSRRPRDDRPATPGKSADHRA